MANVKSASKSVNRRSREQIFRFASLDGGLNLRDAEINLQDNESPEMVNLWRADGVLQSRPGQQIAASGWRDASGDNADAVHAFPDGETVYAAATLPDGIVTHIGAAFYTWQGDSSSLLRAPADDIPRNPGTFFRFGDTLYYKNVGGFYRLTYDAAQTPPLTLSSRRLPSTPNPPPVRATRTSPRTAFRRISAYFIGRPRLPKALRVPETASQERSAWA